VEAITIIAMLVFWVIIASIIGGVILLKPVSKKLGNFLDEWIAIRRAEQEGSGERFQEQAARLAALEEEQYRLREHQEFMESLEEREKPRPIGVGSDLRQP
jgi:hypothetical protein